MKQTRNSSLDLLKIISIMMVIILHYNYVSCGGLWGAVVPGTINFYLAHLSEGLSIIACNLFVMISGYYLCQNQKIKVRKIIDILLLLITYGLVIYIFALKMNLTSFNKNSFKLMVETINSRWFIDIYLLLSILHPFLNKIIKNISKKQFQFLIIVHIFCFYVWRSITYPSDLLMTSLFVADNGYGILNFMTLYLIAAYIRLYMDNLKIYSLYLFVVYLLIGFYVGYRTIYDINFLAYNHILNLVNTVILFLLFKNLKLTLTRKISHLSSVSLAVYIIHENWLIRQWLFRELFRTKDYYFSNKMILHMLLTCIGIFCLCYVIEMIRRLIFRYTIDRILNKSKICNFIYEI